MSTEYFLETYIVSLFSIPTSVTLKQLQHIGSGKRTPSVLFNVEKNKLYVLFGLFPDLTVSKWEHLINYLIKEQLLTMKSDRLCLTSKGEKVKTDFQNDHHFSNDLDQLRYSATKKLFWKRVIFVTQVLSEYSYRNKHYVPYLSSLDDQNSTKKWLTKQKRPMNKLSTDWYEEINTLLQSLPPVRSNFIAGHFVGHDYSGSTSRQLQDAFNLNPEHYSIKLNQLSYQIGQLDEKRYPLLRSLWNHTHADCDEGLSHSARVSKQLLEKGMDLSVVAAQRKLKLNTIKEHILECVLIAEWPYFKRYITETHYVDLKEVFEANGEISYSEAKQHINDLDFFTFRLIEIERIRSE